MWFNVGFRNNKKKKEIQTTSSPCLLHGYLFLTSWGKLNTLAQRLFTMRRVCMCVWPTPAVRSGLGGFVRTGSVEWRWLWECRNDVITQSPWSHSHSHHCCYWCRKRHSSPSHPPPLCPRAKRNKKWWYFQTCPPLHTVLERLHPVWVCCFSAGADSEL